jgi:carbamoyl-phosphate synthase large subunit
MRGVRLLSIERESGTDFRRNKPNSWRVNLEDFLETLSTEEWTPLVVMEFLSGPEYSVDVYKREEKTIILPRVRDEMRAGISMATTLDFNEEIVSQTDAFLDHYEIEGLLGFQYILTKNGPRILECNPRIQGTMVASRLTGINLAWLEAKWQLRLPFENEDFIQNSVNGTFRRSWGGVLYFADGKIETF